MLEKEIREELESKWGPVIAVDAGSDTFAFRCPAPADMDRLHTRQKREDPEATERLVRECCVYGLEEFNALLFNFPFAFAGLWDIFRGHFGGKATVASPDEVPSEASGDKFLLFGSQVIGVGKPGRDHSKRFMAEMKDDPRKAEEFLARSRVLFSGPEPFDSWVSRHPFAFTTIADEVVTLGGFGSATLTTSVGK
jgi:hypothetical protein